jgi:hypothetical protein
MEQVMEGHTVRDNYHKPLPYTYIQQDELPDNFYWGNVNGHSYLTHSLNQHIPQVIIQPRCSFVVVLFFVLFLHDSEYYHHCPDGDDR